MMDKRAAGAPWWLPTDSLDGLVCVDTVDMSGVSVVGGSYRIAEAQDISTLDPGETLAGFDNAEKEVSGYLYALFLERF
jgi:hypothetical protein